jgi:shikimate dehydrogenase
MHNAAFNQLGLDYVYVPFPVKPENLGLAVDGIRGLSLAGVNVTIPHKSAVIKFLDEVSPEARLIGAVNTIVNTGGILKGYNTDAPGFLRALEAGAGVTPRGKRIFILGAGGAARAVAVQMALEGAAEITFTSPYPEEIGAIRDTVTGCSKTAVSEVPWDETDIVPSLDGIDILINATPLGMYPDTEKMPPVRLGCLPDKALVCDLIYNPGETSLLKRAKERGLITLNGMGMLLYQGVIAFEKWTGTAAPVEVMRKTLDSLLTR